MAHTNTRWTPERDDALVAMVNAGCSGRQAAEKLSATIVAVYQRVRNLGLSFKRHTEHAPAGLSEIEEIKYAVRVRILRRLREGQNGCLEWSGSLSGRGYGQVRIANKCRPVHRVVMEAEIGRLLPSGVFVCHRCDNPKCARIEHLFIGTQKDNMLDAKSKGRMKMMFEPGHRTPYEKLPRGEKAKWSKLRVQDVIEMRRMKRELGYGAKRLGKLFGISKSTAHDVLSRRTWAHVPIPGGDLP